MHRRKESTHKFSTAHIVRKSFTNIHIVQSCTNNRPYDKVAWIIIKKIIGHER